MKFALIGNPNVGKSLIFNQLTGIGVEISNFPGTTVDMLSGNVCYQRERFELIDFPGIYSLEGKTEEEEQVRSYLRSNNVDALIVVLDATKLERNLYLLFQAAEYKIPLITVVNIADEAEKKGTIIDYEKISSVLGCRVIPTIALEGKNIDLIIPAAMNDAAIIDLHVPYGKHIEAGVRSLVKLTGCSRMDALLALQGIGEDSELMEAAGTIASEIEEDYQMSPHQIIATNRHNEAARIASEVIETGKVSSKKISFDIDSLLTRVFPGVPILIAVLFIMLLAVFIIGSFLEELIVEFFETWIIGPMYTLGLSPFWEKMVFSLLIAIEAGLGIAFPFVFTFYILVSILEDSGYMTRGAFLVDRAMHRIGMHGQALIPMILGFGCNVPAIMSIRQLSKRERIIASFLITMVPCSARTVIIAGIVAVFVGITAAFSIYLLVFFLIILTGFVLTRFAPGEQYGMILEMSPLRKPHAGQTLMRAWLHMKEFLFIAMPLLLVSSVFLGMLDFFGILADFQMIFAPFMEQVLGLPDYASTSLIFGIFRKEMAFETLAVLAGTADLGAVMSASQLYIFAVVSVLFVPCISTIAVLYREMGLKIAAMVSCYTLCLGMVCGAILNFIFKIL